jgi:hypothetical protein
MEEEILDTNWIDSIEEIENDNDIFYKEKINEITLIFLYINNNEVEYTKKDYLKLKTPGVLSKENLINIIHKNKINNSIKYSLNSILKFNITIEPENIKNFVIEPDTSQQNELFFSKIKTVDDINWEDSINMFEHLNTLFFIYNLKKPNNSSTKRVIFKKQNTTRKKI